MRRHRGRALGNMFLTTAECFIIKSHLFTWKEYFYFGGVGHQTLVKGARTGTPLAVAHVYRHTCGGFLNVVHEQSELILLNKPIFNTYSETSQARSDT